MDQHFLDWLIADTLGTGSSALWGFLLVGLPCVLLAKWMYDTAKGHDWKADLVRALVVIAIGWFVVDRYWL